MHCNNEASGGLFSDLSLSCLAKLSCTNKRIEGLFVKVATELQVVAKGSRVCHSTIFALAVFLYCSYKRGYSHTMERQMRQKSENTSEFRKSIIVFAKSIVGGLRVSVNTCTVEEAGSCLSHG